MRWFLIAFCAAALLFAPAAFAEQPCDCWIDVKTGKQVNTIPGGCLYEDEGHLHSGYKKPSGDPNRAYNPKTGQNFARVPRPPPGKTQPTPSQASGDTIKKVLQSVNIGIGIGSGGGQKRTDDQKKP
jgi:hypothetical protein